jgi:hypothetical protein
MKTRRFLFLDLTIGILAGFNASRFLIQEIDYLNTGEAASLLAPVITMLGLTTWRMGLHLHYKKRDSKKGSPPIGTN